MNTKEKDHDCWDEIENQYDAYIQVKYTLQHIAFLAQKSIIYFKDELDIEDESDIDFLNITDEEIYVGRLNTKPPSFDPQSHEYSDDNHPGLDDYQIASTEHKKVLTQLLYEDLVMSANNRLAKNTAFKPLLDRFIITAKDPCKDTLEKAVIVLIKSGALKYIENKET